MRTEIIVLLCILTPGLALADNIVHPGSPVFDRPTLTTLGVQLPITGDDNFNAAVSVRYRKTGTSNWRQGLPLFRVHPENTALWTVAPQFAGSVFDLRPNTSYDVELHLTDPDGPVDQIYTLTTATRPVPADPLNPRIVNVSDALTVKLHFAEFYRTQAGQRTFNIVINGTTYFSNFDILAVAPTNTAYDLSIPVTVGNGQITIQLVPVSGPAKVNAIEIF